MKSRETVIVHVLFVQHSDSVGAVGRTQGDDIVCYVELRAEDDADLAASQRFLEDLSGRNGAWV